jgi:outer membrane murein-binding lipoprotein Lpp
MNLYEIDDAILECVDVETGEIINPEMLDALTMERTKKIENIGCWIKNLTADAAAIKAEKDALAARQKAAESKAASLKRYLLNALQGEKFKSPRVAISYRKSDSVMIAKDAKIPEKYLKFAEPTPDKVGLKAALKSGQTFDGITLEETQNIQIK